MKDVSEVPESGTSLFFPFPVVTLSTVNKAERGSSSTQLDNVLVHLMNE